MKKLASVILAGIMAMSLVACKEDSAPANPKSQETPLGQAVNGEVAFGNVFEGCKVGDYVTFGKYEQDNNLENGKESIEWLVIDKKDGKALVISKMGLDGRAYYGAYEDITWENSLVRNWLNADFYNGAFTDDERNLISETVVSAQSNEKFKTDAGADTSDKIFLLNIDEVNKYFATDDERTCKPSEYAVAQGVWKSDSTGNGEWWLRTPGKHQSNATYVKSSGAVDVEGSEVRMFYAIRPAMWVSAE